jgi:pyruvate carboxylase
LSPKKNIDPRPTSTIRDKSVPPMPGLVVTVAVQTGDMVRLGQKLLTLEAMKMETTVYAERAGKITEMLVSPGTQVDTNDLLMRLE